MNDFSTQHRQHQQHFNISDNTTFQFYLHFCQPHFSLADKTYKKYKYKKKAIKNREKKEKLSAAKEK